MPRKFTPDQLDRIIQLKLDCVTVRKIAEEIGCDKDTVTKVWWNWLDETAVDRRDNLERHRSEQIAHLGSVAEVCRQGASRARATGDAGAEVRFLTEERQARRALCTVAGFDAPIRMTATFETMTEEEADRLLGIDNIDLM